ncbi:hypothetical protein K493DRAFT_316914 [Basidiobolus meristosporus CBS 931.73]|uniref:Uncharacterized protein n=1 Tax=Basidiobolus meristosporus CBS 931.73 TaxID=1314790 RepID=A0A1Y1Y2Q2_9FUNG|nr:hypothetical protein K493DRAFT_316914 [Basidiobolus meristosporus CBS 931.73]|eukprot:ORX91894.1 hypothetical protein K493DRAFT_316914 [Basidiobolus meristosporus CBS 931.73]
MGSGQWHRQGKNFKPRPQEYAKRLWETKNQQASKFDKATEPTEITTSSHKVLVKQKSCRDPEAIIDELSELTLDEPERECTLFNHDEDVKGIEFWSMPAEHEDVNESSTEQMNFIEPDAAWPSSQPEQIEASNSESIEVDGTAKSQCQGEILMILEIEIHDGAVKSIPLHEHDIPLEVAKQFCNEWNIPSAKAVTRLAQLITLHKEQSSTL